MSGFESETFADVLKRLSRQARATAWIADAEKAINAERQASSESMLLSSVECTRDSQEGLVVDVPKNESRARCKVGRYSAFGSCVKFYPENDGKKEFGISAESVLMWSEVEFTRHLSNLLGTMMDVGGSLRTRDRCETCKFWNALDDLDVKNSTDPTETTVTSEWGECRRHAPRPIQQCLMNAASRTEVTGTVIDGEVELRLEEIYWDKNVDWHHAFNRRAHWPVTSSYDTCGDYQWEPQCIAPEPE